MSIKIKGYLTNLGKYNEGILMGEWITFPIDEEELNEVLKRLCLCYTDKNGEYHKTRYEEYFFTDWDCDFDCDFGEYESISEINELAEKLNEWDEDTFNVACDIWGIKEVLEHEPDDYILYSDVKDEYDLGYYWLEESGCYDLSTVPKNIRNYFDYNAFGRDIAIEANGGFTDYGFIECVG